MIKFEKPFLRSSNNNGTIDHASSGQLKLYASSWKFISVFDDYNSQPLCCPQQLTISLAMTLVEIQDTNRYSPALAQDICGRFLSPCRQVMINMFISNSVSSGFYLFGIS